MQVMISWIYLLGNIVMNCKTKMKKTMILIILA